MSQGTTYAVPPFDPYAKPARPVPQPGQPITDWGLAIDAPLRLDDPDAYTWDEQADMVVVGLGGAGIAAALQGLEEGLSVVAVDQYDGGGSSAANGGVYYAGGGTSIQKEAGIEDTPERMFTYLKAEAGDVVSDETLRDFCETSPATLDWLRGHGAPFQASYHPEKTSYPPIDKFLYHPDSTLSAPFRDITPPAARGHRVHFRNGNKPWGVGAGMYNKLREAALAKGMVFHPTAEARQLALDGTGRVIGVRVLRFADAATQAKYSKLMAKGAAWMSMLPGTFPGSRVTMKVGYRYLAKARALEGKGRVSVWIRARKGVVLSAGGFICNPAMVRHFAPEYAPGLPNGTLGDNGSGIMLGVTAGGKTALMERVSAWRFLNPPKAWGQAMLVDGKGARFVNETWYGARIGDEMVERHDGRGYIILDQKLFKKALRDAFGHGVLGFQRDITIVNCLFAATRGKTPEDLARKMGFDPATFAATLDAYNRTARGEGKDPFYKTAEEMIALDQGPYYAIDASVDARMFPIACMTVGGLAVDEATGAVQGVDGGAVPGLYAAGRNAVGLCSNLYVSGLSYSDCIYSGRRAARAMAAT
ncbi:MAG: FAD-binding protein [Novosphingobium sp.]|nr:FAD-binding protein [Novosphingobium sp.]